MKLLRNKSVKAKETRSNIQQIRKDQEITGRVKINYLELVDSLKDRIHTFTQRKHVEIKDERKIVDTFKVNQHMQKGWKSTKHKEDEDKDKETINRTPNKRIKIKPLEREEKILNKSVDVQVQIGVKSQLENFMSKHTETDDEYNQVIFKNEKINPTRATERVKKIIDFSNKPAGIYEKILIDTQFNRTPEFTPVRKTKRMLNQMIGKILYKVDNPNKIHTNDSHDFKNRCLNEHSTFENQKDLILNVRLNTEGRQPKRLNDDIKSSLLK